MSTTLKNFARGCLHKIGLTPIRQSALYDKSLLERELAAMHAHSIVSTASADGIMLHCNARFQEALGYSEAEIVGKEISVLYADVDYGRFAEIRDTLAQGTSWSGEQPLKHKNGNTVWVSATIYPIMDDAGNHIKSISIRTDITDSKHVQSEKDMYRALHMMQDEIFLLCTTDLRYVYMNEAAMRRFDWSAADFAGKTMMTAHPDFDRASFEDKVRPLLQGDVTEVRFIEDLCGETYENTIQLMRTANGKERFACIRHNVSERVALDKAKDEFTATVSHELRSPLTSIKGGIGLVLSGATGELSDKARNLLEIAHRNSERLVLIVNDMLELDKIAAGQMVFEMRHHDAGKLFSEALMANESYLAQYGVRVVTKGLEDAHHIYCDPDRMLQVLNNLLSNAAKFSHRGGEVHAILDTSEQGVHITVQDFGVGIPKSAQATIFDRFTQAKTGEIERRGTGLGLSIVKAIVEHHYGNVELKSLEGEGTTFRIFVPHHRPKQGSTGLKRAS